MKAMLVGSEQIDLPPLERLFKAAGWDLCRGESEMEQPRPPSNGSGAAELARVRAGPTVPRDTVVLVDAHPAAVTAASDVILSLRRDGIQHPIAVLSPPLEDRGARAAVAAALRAGADDFFLRSIGPAELSLRLRALVQRRRRGSSISAFCIGDLEIDRASRILTCDGESIALTACEYRAFQPLADRLGKPVSRDLLLRRVRTSEHVSSNMVDVYILYLRRKLARIGSCCVIKTLRGTGYMLVVGGETSRNSVCGGRPDLDSSLTKRTVVNTMP
jgi:DNA-binding response OmpR family regulator